MVHRLDWEFVTSVFKIVQIREYYEIFKIRKNLFDHITSNCKSNSSNSYNTSYSCREHFLCNRGNCLMRTVGSWRVNES